MNLRMDHFCESNAGLYLPLPNDVLRAPNFLRLFGILLLGHHQLHSPLNGGIGFGSDAAIDVGSTPP